MDLGKRLGQACRVGTLRKWIFSMVKFFLDRIYADRPWNPTAESDALILYGVFGPVWVDREFWRRPLAVDVT